MGRARGNVAQAVERAPRSQGPCVGGGVGTGIPPHPGPAGAELGLWLLCSQPSAARLPRGSHKGGSAPSPHGPPGGGRSQAPSGSIFQRDNFPKAAPWGGKAGRVPGPEEEERGRGGVPEESCCEAGPPSRPSSGAAEPAVGPARSLSSRAPFTHLPSRGKPPLNPRPRGTREPHRTSAGGSRGQRRPPLPRPSSQAGWRAPPHRPVS